MPFANVGTPLTSILLWRDVVFGSVLCILHLCVVLFQKWNAPAAAGSRAPTLTDLTRATWLVDSDEVENLSPGDVKAVTDFVVGFQRGNLSDQYA